MTEQEAKEFLSSRGLSTCSCKYNGPEELIREAVRLKNLEEQQKTPTISEG